MTPDAFCLYKKTTDIDVAVPRWFILFNDSAAFVQDDSKHAILIRSVICFSNGAGTPSGPGSPYYQGFTITLRHTKLGRSPLDERSARRKDVFPITHDTHKRQTSMVPATERPQTHASDSLATGIGVSSVTEGEKFV
jgi:hypothetical protein